MITTTTPDHLLLAEYARSRDAEAIAELVRRHAGLVFATARRITRNPDDAHDVSQECFLELLRRVAQIDAPLPAWLHRVASTRALNLIRNAATRHRHEARVAQVSSEPAEPDWHETEAILDELLEGLPDDLRAPLVMHYLQGQSQADVAAALDVNQSTISRRLKGGVDALRDALAQRGVTYSASAALSIALEKLAAEKAPASLISALGKMALAGPRPRVPAHRASLASVGATAAAGIVLAVGLVALIVWLAH